MAVKPSMVDHQEAFLLQQQSADPDSHPVAQLQCYIVIQWHELWSIVNMGESEELYASHKNRKPNFI